MNLYRIVRADRTGLDGKGAAEYPGRWNTEGVPCVYTSSTPALAQLEVMVNADDWKIFLTVKHVLLHLTIPDDRVYEVPEEDLPAGWADSVFDRETQEMGATLLKKPDMLAFSIPSAVSKTERNIVLNPRVADFKDQVRTNRMLPFEFDQRLLK